MSHETILDFAKATLRYGNDSCSSSDGNVVARCSCKPQVARRGSTDLDEKLRSRETVTMEALEQNLSIISTVGTVAEKEAI